MRMTVASMLASLLAAGAPAVAGAQSGGLSVPASVKAGGTFSIATTGSGPAVLYIVGPGQAIRRNVQMGEPISIPAGVLYNAGDYVAVLVQGSSTETGQLEVVAADHPAKMAFLAEPSRLPVGVQDGISGTTYVFDAYGNLIPRPERVSFQLSTTTEAASVAPVAWTTTTIGMTTTGTMANATAAKAKAAEAGNTAHAAAGPAQEQTATTRDGVAWVRMNSASREGAAKFVATVEGVSSMRVIDEVPGDPCNLTMNAKADGNRVALETAPLHDCSGNPIPDGTVVTFTETLDGRESTADVPLKRDVAKVEMPAWNGATISVASGVVAGNAIRWSGR